MSYVQQNRTRIIGALATALAAVGIAVGSGASFTAQTANAGNAFSSGALEMTNSKGSAAIFNGSRLKPGESTTGSVTIKNTGSVAGDFRLSERNADETFDAPLKLKVTEGAKIVYDGSFGTMGTLDLGTYASEEQHTYEFTVTLDAAATNTDKNKTATASYQWDATTVAP